MNSRTPSAVLAVPAGLAALAAFTAPSHAAPLGDVWVVDAALGAGADFATIQEAVTAASAGDTVLVRSGTYPSFQLISKNLAVVADDGATVRVLGGPYVAYTPQGPPNVLHGLRFAPAPDGSGLAFLSTGDLGAGTWMSDCSTESAWLNISSSSTVVDHCVFRGPAAGSTTLGNFGLPAVNLGIAFLAAFATEFHGGDGRDASPAGPATSGAAGVFDEYGGAVWAAASTFQGGAGGAGALGTGGCEPGADGGPGLRLESGWLYEGATQLLGGNGGAAAPACPGTEGAAGAPIELGGPFAFHSSQVAPTPLLTAPGVAREGQPIAFDYEGPAGLGVLLLGGANVFQHTSFSPLSDGSMPLLVGGPTLLSVIGNLTSPGTASIGFTVPNLPAGVESTRLYAQALHVDLSTFAVVGGGSRTVVLLDSAF